MVAVALVAVPALLAVHEELVLLAPPLGGAVAGMRSPGDVSGRVSAGLAVWVVLVVVGLHVEVLLFALGEASGWDAAAVAGAVLGFPIGLLLAGVGGLLGAAAVGVVPTRVGDVLSAGEGTVPTVREVPILRTGGAVVGGTLGTGAGAIGAMMTGHPVVLLGAPVFGGFLAGHWAPEGRGLALLAGLLAGLLWGVVLVGLFFWWVATAAGLAYGAGIVLVLLVLLGLVGIPLSGAGALLASLD